jgi:hypothetical protein
MNAQKIQVGLRLEPDVLKKIAWLAKKQKRSLNSQIEFAVEQSVEDYEATHGPVPVESEI